MLHQKLITRFYTEVFAKGNCDLVDEILAPDFIWRRHALPLEPEPGREGIKQFVRALHKAFPDMNFHAESTLVRWR